MPQFLPPLRLTGAYVLRDGEMQRRSLAIDEGRLTTGPLPEVALPGYLLLPGIIDLHSDGFAPRPGARVNWPSALAAADRRLAAQGITTAFLAQGWSWEGGLRSPDQAEAMLAALDDHRPAALTDLRAQLRAETHLTDQAGRLLEAVRRHQLGYVIFNNHLGQALASARRGQSSLARRARRVGTTVADLTAGIEAACAHAREVPRSLCRLAEAFDTLGVTYGSHDDPDGETREYFTALGARVAEFPLTRKAASAAHEMMCPVLMGAPNLLRGGSRAGNVGAEDLIRQGLCDALVSDGDPTALARAAWALVDRGILPLPRAWALISARPASILRLVDRGQLDPGKRADLVVVHEASRRIEAVIAAGRLVWATGEAGARIAARQAPGRLAAE